MTSQYMKELAARFTEEGGEHLTQNDKDMVMSAFAPAISEVTYSLKVNLLSGERSRSVDNLEEIHKIIELIDCL